MIFSTETETGILDRLKDHPAAKQSWSAFGNGMDRLQVDDFLQFVVDYVDFNAHIPAGMLSAAAAVHASEAIFPPVGDNPISPASIISSHMLVAVVDEFASPTGERVTHRALGRALLAGVCDAMGIDESQVPPVKRDYRAQIDTGYGMWVTPQPERVLRSIGVHFAAELSGGEENVIIDRRLRELRPDVIEKLGERSPHTGAPAYTWILTHLDVEDEHSDAAGRAVEMAASLSSYPDAEHHLTSGFLEWFELLDSFTQHSLPAQ